MTSSLATTQTCSSSMATQESGGKPCIIGTRNCRQPDQWTMRSIMLSRLNIFMKRPRDFSNWEQKKDFQLEGAKWITFAIVL